MELGNTSKRHSGASPSDQGLTKKRRTLVSVACNTCRARKTKCDGVRPTCAPCATRSLPCRYESEPPGAGRMEALWQDNETLREEVASLRRQLDHLRSDSHAGPATVSDAFNKRIVDLATASCQASQTPELNLTVSPSYHQTLRSILPPTQSQLEFELICKHPNAYQVLEPIADSQAVAITLLSYGDPPKELSIVDSSISDPASLSSQLSYQLSDLRLRDLQISYWTTVAISDDQATSVISLYLHNQHPILGTFDADLFVEDLIGRRLRFCSSFLVNALLYYACQAYTVFDPGVAELSWAFYAEAKKIWQADRSNDSLLNVAALQVMSYGCTCNGLDDETDAFIKLSFEMADRLALYEDPTVSDQPARNLEDATVDEKLRCQSHIAWGMFCSMNAYAFYYRRPPTKDVPALPMPGLPGFPIPAYMGTTITSLCKFWVIGRECALLYAGGADDIASRVPAAAMEAKYQQLLAFADELVSLSGNHRIPHHAAILQIWYHTVIVSLMQPWMNQDLILRTFTSTGSTPERISRASLRQLKRLMINFRLHYPQARYNVQYNPCLLFIANSALADSDHDPEWQFYFMACLYGWGNLYPAYRLAELCFKGLLTIAMEKKKIKPKVARRLIEELSRSGEHHQKAKAHSAMHLDLAGKSEGTVEELAARFESTALDDGDDDEADLIMANHTNERKATQGCTSHTGVNDDDEGDKDNGETNEFSNDLFDDLINIDDNEMMELLRDDMEDPLYH